MDTLYYQSLRKILGISHPFILQINNSCRLIKGGLPGATSQIIIPYRCVALGLKKELPNPRNFEFGKSFINASEGGGWRFQKGLFSIGKHRKINENHWKIIENHTKKSNKNWKQQCAAFGGAPRGRRFAPPPWVVVFNFCLTFWYDFQWFFNDFPMFSYAK